MKMEIDNLSGEAIALFLDEHIADMKSVSPPESKHALDLEGLREPEITFWSIREGNKILGCAALKHLSADHAEIKSMRTSPASRGNGIASYMLQYILDTARHRGYLKLSLETGSMPYFEAARKLYEKFGFVRCLPFADYKEDPNSLFMTKTLSAEKIRSKNN